MIGPTSGQCMGNTARSTTSPALTMGGFCVEVRVEHHHHFFAEKRVLSHLPQRRFFVGLLFFAGRGACVSSQCVCADGWTGESCSCPISTATCQSANGLLCSGRGRCTCGRCACDDPQYSGDFCEKCPACQSTCQSHWYGFSSQPQSMMGLLTSQE